RYFYEALKMGKFCYVFNARQMGKTSLWTRTKAKLEKEGFICVYITATLLVEQEEMTPKQWYRGIIGRIVKGLAWKDFDDEKWWLSQINSSSVNSFSDFIEDILLKRVPNYQKIIIAIDEIDQILNLKFNLDSFFAVIRECSNNRAMNPIYSKLTFALIGVTTPTDLIQDKNSTPFNNDAEAINLTGFKLQEALPLAQGLVEKTNNSEAVLREILGWTGGQPFLTQKICKIVQNTESLQAGYNLEEWIEDIIKKNIINNWEYQDNPEHLRTIENRIINSFHAKHLFNLYGQILDFGELQFDNSREQMELRLSGLVVNRQGKLVTYNKIYQEIFNQEWLNSNLDKVLERPYQIQMEAWISSDYQDQSKLLFGKELKNVQKWSQDLLLTREDDRFLDESKKFEQDVRARLPSIESWESVVAAVMSWTGGNENLNKSLLFLLSQEKKPKRLSPEKWVQTRVNSRMIKNWETEANAEPLREISRSLLENSLCDPFWLLIAYRKVLLSEKLDSQKEQEELKKIKIVIEKGQDLAIANPIYANVFNLRWTNQNLGRMRPYAKKLVAWIDSERQDKSQLLTARELQAAEEFLMGKKLDTREDRFIVDSMLMNT
ncbi:MAG: hypothetical protein F6K47_15445, partial [Symploca sp. SIO2E6]|nr:hypothetical protein [Symploca sp. SIO2E6]